MKIAFWSNAGEKCAVSANMAAVSIACVSRFPYKIVAMENHFCPAHLGKAFQSSGNHRMLRKAGTNYYEGGGIEGLLRSIYREDNQNITLPFYMKEIINKRLFYIPQDRIIPSGIFEFEFNTCIDSILQLVEEYADICLIDTASQYNLTSKTILEESDLIVVNLCQNPSVLEDFIQNYSSIIPKSVFIINNYIYHSTLHSRRIAKMYEIPWEKMIVVPVNEMYQNAYERGSVAEFITSNYRCGKEDANYLFIQSIKKAAYIMIKNAEAICNKNGGKMSQC